MNEIWKYIDGYDCVYQVSNLGNVKSVKTINANKHRCRRTYEKEIILKPNVNKLGYCRVNLYYNHKKKFVSIHRLVAIAFLPNFENKPDINHKNGIKTDNSINNLEWCTQSENEIHAYKHGLKKYSKQNNKLVLDLMSGIFYESVIEAARAKGYVQSTLTHRLNGRLPNNTSLIYA